MRLLCRGIVVLVTGMIAGWAGTASADPCGMVPPASFGDQVPLVRVGDQQTYVFYRDEVETFVIRPGFSGKVDEFGMLIPFPAPPAIRKVPDHIFGHIAAAVDPPEVVVDLRPPPPGAPVTRAAAPASGRRDLYFLRKSQVRVLREEAVGMYEVAVLEAGSTAALKRWMDKHGYKFPQGMDVACGDYVKLGWCFVAVKTKVGQKRGVDPQPGQRNVNARRPAGTTFDGAVQAMGFRFPSKQLVVPMRLSAFNKGELRNIVYILTDGPRKIRSIPEEYVVRQIRGPQLYKHLTGPLPLRILGGDVGDLSANWLKRLPKMRDPLPKNGAARDLFAGDLSAVRGGRLALAHEEQEKVLLRIGERLGLRGGEIDKLHEAELAAKREQTAKTALAELKKMTLTVVDGDFPRDVLAGKNLTFAQYRMPSRRNTPATYDAKTKGPAPKKQGVLRVGRVEPGAGAGRKSPRAVAAGRASTGAGGLWGLLAGLTAVLVVAGFASRSVPRRP